MDKTVTRTILSKTGFAALTFGLLLAGCGQRPPSDETAQQPQSFVRVATAEGEVQGIAEDGLVEYKGIPYAAAPTGDLRWRAPQPPLQRDSVLVADQYGNRCIQRPATEGFAMEDAFTQPASEDCLYLNIYRPDNADAGRPEWPLAEYENTMYFTPDGVNSRKDTWLARLDALNELVGM